MSAPEEHKYGYPLDRGWLESLRLDAQHRVTVKRTGWLLHPRVTDHIKANANTTDFRVADLACGTGSMTVDLHDQFPNLSITGFDISTQQFPAAWTLPAQLKFEELDLLQDIPQKYVGMFDVLHMRFLTGALLQGGQDKLVANLLALLKPGGWLQWQEVRHPFWAEVNRDTMTLSEEETNWTKVMKPMAPLQKADHWLRKLDEFVTTNGFENAEMYYPPLKGTALQETTRVILLSMLEIEGVAKEKMPPDMLPKFRQTREEMEQRARDGTQYGYHTFLVTARKPRDK